MTFLCAGQDEIEPPPTNKDNIRQQISDRTHTHTLAQILILRAEVERSLDSVPTILKEIL